MANSKKITNPTNLIFLIGIIGISLFFIIFTVFMVAKPFAITNYSQMKTVTYNDYTTQSTKKHTSYYVYIYDEKDENCIELLPAILDYANYARTHNSAKPIYILNARDKQNTAKTYTAPTVVLIEDEKASTSYTSYAKIINQLSSIIVK